MTLDQIVAFLGFAMVMAGTPGPSNTLLTATGGQVGVARGLPALLGVCAGMALMMFLVAFGLGSILVAVPVILVAAKCIGAAVLIWFAWNIARSSSVVSEYAAQPVGFLGAAAFQWVNPKSWLACASAAGMFGAGQAVWLAVLFVVAALPSCFVWLAFGASIQRLLRSKRAARTFNLAMATLLLASLLLLVI